MLTTNSARLNKHQTVIFGHLQKATRPGLKQSFGVSHWQRLTLFNLGAEPADRPEP